MSNLQLIYFKLNYSKMDNNILGKWMLAVIINKMLIDYPNTMLITFIKIIYLPVCMHLGQIIQDMESSYVQLMLNK